VQFEENQQKKRKRLEMPIDSSPHGNDELEDTRLIVPFQLCQEAFFEEEIIEYTNPSIGYPAPTMKNLRFGSFPPYYLSD
jgi:hypothetical protein